MANLYRHEEEAGSISSGILLAGLHSDSTGFMAILLTRWPDDWTVVTVQVSWSGAMSSLWKTVAALGAILGCHGFQARFSPAGQLLV